MVACLQEYILDLIMSVFCDMYVNAILVKWFKKDCKMQLLLQGVHIRYLLHVARMTLACSVFQIVCHLKYLVWLLLTICL